MKVEFSGERKRAPFILAHPLAKIATVFTVCTAVLQAAESRPKFEEKLETVLKNVLANNGQIKESASDIEVARGQLARANAALWPKGTVTVLGAPLFEERGDAVRSRSNLGKWGPFVTGSLELAQPLYTFGQIGNYRKAAENQVSAKTELTEAKKLEVIAQAKEIYFGYLMAAELEALVDGLIEFLGEAVNSAEEQLKKKKKSVVKPHDVYRLKTSLDDLQQKKLYAKQAKQTAEKAVHWMEGAPTAEAFGKISLVAPKFEKKTLEDYLKLARSKRPELKALAAGQVARLALADAKQAQSYPVIFIGALASAGLSPVRDRQLSAYAWDPFNRVQGGIGLGVKLDLEFARHAAESSEEQAEAMKLKATESYAVPGIDVQVSKAFWEMEQALEGVAVAERRRQVSKKWFVSSAMGWSIGVTPAKDLMEALEGDGLAKQNYIQTVYMLNLALAKLTAAVGEEVTGLKYR